MNQLEADSFFNYLAFDDESWELLAHGRTTLIALRAAEKIAPNTAIRIIHAAPFGRIIWDRGVQLYFAERALRRARDALEQLRPGKIARQADRTLH